MASIFLFLERDGNGKYKWCNKKWWKTLTMEQMGEHFGGTVLARLVEEGMTKEDAKRLKRYRRNEMVIRNTNNHRKRPEIKEKYNASEYKFNLILKSMIKKLIKNASKKHVVFSNEENIECENVIGCSVKNLVGYIESMFEPWMNWGNWGKYDPHVHDINPTWQLDHVLPLAFAIKNPELLPYAMNFKNLRPLCAKKNNMKRDKVILELVSDAPHFPFLGFKGRIYETNEHAGL